MSPVYPDTHHHPTEDIVFGRLKLRAPHAVDEIDDILSEHRLVIASGTRFLETIQAVQDEVGNYPRKLRVNRTNVFVAA